MPGSNSTMSLSLRSHQS
ncbi:rCG41476 [Rattus norvegicus]|uniref:RCG41476 n=1 Tax=Rattus norvegicus TaxID=10116 RepID=A6IHH5_RAT|nr:rCG41476 [Rattus norvegicus]